MQPGNPPARRRLLSAVLALGAAAAFARPVRADDASPAPEPAVTAEAVKLSEAGLALYNARDYRHAAERFLQAFTLSQDPNLLFNIARCYEALGDPEAAVEKYQAFLATPDADAQGKRRATEAIRALRPVKDAASPAARAGTAPGDDPELARTPAVRTTSVSDGRYGELSVEGLAFYRAHDYRRAAEKFLQAYAFDPDPNLLFNLARCYGALGDSASAAEKYEAYLKAAGTDAEGRSRARAALRALRPGRAEGAAEVPGAHLLVGDGRDGLDTPRAGHGRVIAGWVATGVLTAATVTTGVLALDSARKLSAARASFPGDSSYLSTRAAKTTALSLAADGLGIGALLVGSLSLYWTLASPSPSKAKAPTAASTLKATVGPGGVGVSGSF